MAGGIAALSSRFGDFLSSRGHAVAQRPAFAPSPRRTEIITTGGTITENNMNSTQRRLDLQEAIASWDGDATNNILAQETSLQKTSSAIDTNIDTGTSFSDVVGGASHVEYVDLGNENHANVGALQELGVDQIGHSEDGANATNNAYYLQDNTQLGDSDTNTQVNTGSAMPAPGADGAHPNYLLAWFTAVQEMQQEPSGANGYREEPVFNFATASSELDSIDREALAGLIRTVGKSASNQSRQAARAIYALARMVGTGGNESSFNRNASRLEEALQPMDPNAGYDYNGQDAQVFTNAIQYLVDTIPNFVLDDPELIAQIQYSLADIANTLSPGGMVNQVA